MKLRHTVNTIRKNGSRDSASQEFAADSVIIGRGGAATLLVEGASVSLEHARLTLRDSGLVLEDLPSIGGTKVNDVLITMQILKSGDVIKVGDHAFTVSQADPWWILSEERREEGLESVEDKVTRLAREFKALPAIYSVKGLSLILALLTVVVYFVFPSAGGSKRSWSAGEVTNNHKMIENNCKACHSEAFGPVHDADCRACHAVTTHAAPFQHGSLKERQCVECHSEHSGDAALMQQESSSCTFCHGAITAVYAKSKLPAISSFSNHPEFRVPIASAAGEGPHITVERVSLSNKAKAVDRSGVKLNHKVHLEENIRGAKGKVTLQCRDCHEPSLDLKSILPITFERHCQSCHPLGFDDKLPGNEVPHGEPDVVYNFMFAEYAKLFLASAAEVQDNQDFNIRRKPGYQAIARTEESREFTRAQIQADTRVSEKYLFTRTACQLCHEVAEKTGIDERSKLSRFEVLKTKIPERWMPASIFNHGAHEEIACESCHKGVRSSEATADVLMPGVNNCRDCHTGSAHAGKVGADCVVCHSYHDSLPLDSKSKKDIPDILRVVNALN